MTLGHALLSYQLRYLYIFPILLGSEGALAPVPQQIPQTEAVGDPQPSSPEGWAVMKGMGASHRRLGWGTEPREVPFQE